MKSKPGVRKVVLRSKVRVSGAMKISPGENVYWDRMQQIEKSECENLFLLI